jgi:hypothetical protein
MKVVSKTTLYETIIISNKVLMAFKTAYWIIIILTFLGFIFQIALSKPLIYYFYGYDAGLINSYEVESFRAAQETYQARLLSFYIITGLTAVCFIFSSIAMYMKVYVRNYLTPMVLMISFILLVFYFIASTIATRVF